MEWDLLFPPYPVFYFSLIFLGGCHFMFYTHTESVFLIIQQHPIFGKQNWHFPKCQASATMYLWQLSYNNLLAWYCPVFFLHLKLYRHPRVSHAAILSKATGIAVPTGIDAFKYWPRQHWDVIHGHVWKIRRSVSKFISQENLFILFGILILD